jgi:hypothetical protein
LPDSLPRYLIQRVRYVGSGHHKLKPGDYGFQPPANPRPTKSVYDDLRAIRLEEAQTLFRRGIDLGMVSAFAEGALPKYVWSVDDDEEVYETKIGSPPDYHGYRLGDDEQAMRHYVLKEWRRRCRMR